MRKKGIRIPDKYSWDVAKEYRDDPFTDNSENSRGYYKPSKGQHEDGLSKLISIIILCLLPQHVRFNKESPRQMEQTLGHSESNQTGTSAIMLFGHCSVYCPLNMRMQNITKPTPTQTGAIIAENQKTH